MKRAILTDEQIRSTMFEIPDIGLVLAFGPEIANTMIEARAVVSAHGNHLCYFAWPDGTTISWERTGRHQPLDMDGLVRAYKRFQETVRPLMEAQNGGR
ncbi:MAG: hypothetical protein V5B32_07480 [Candidatus Accumulibacter sp. UW26]|jgi:hypothetical protein